LPPSKHKLDKAKVEKLRILVANPMYGVTELNTKNGPTLIAKISTQQVFIKYDLLVNEKRRDWGDPSEIDLEQHAEIGSVNTSSDTT